MTWLSIIIFVLVGSRIVCGAPAVGGSTVNERYVTKVHLSGRDLGDLLSKASVALAVPVGFEQDLHGSLKEAQVAVDLASGTVGELFDRILGEYPGYTWHEVNGVIHVVPINSELVSEVKIEKLIAIDQSLSQFFLQLTGDEKVNEWASDRGYRLLRLYSGQPSLDRGRRLSIKSDNNNIGTILDEVLIQSGRMFWSITVVKLDDNRNYIAIGF